MRRYVLICIALFAAGCWTGPGVFLFIVPVAVCTAHGRWAQALGLVAVAGWANALALGTSRGVLSSEIIAATGILLGLGLRCRWRYGWAVAGTAVILYAVVALNTVTNWQMVSASFESMQTVFAAGLEEQAADTEVEQNAKLLDALRWQHEHLAELALGSLFWAALVLAAITVAFTQAWVRTRHGLRGLRGSFRRLRLSHWLAWAVIAVAAMWFVDRQWSMPALRIVSWNGALALAAIYWLNGVSILMCALAALRPHVLIYLLVFFLLMSPGIHPVLAITGLFDTWGDFRRVVDKAALALKRRREQADRSA